MRTSQETGKLFAAMAKAQLKLKNPEKNQTAKIPTRAGDPYTFMYVDLPGTIDHIRAVFAEFEITHMEGVQTHEKGTLVTCTFGHSSGQWAASDVLIERESCLTPQKFFIDNVPTTLMVQDEKKLGSKITYFRRYMITSMAGISGDDDLDGTPETTHDVYSKKVTSNHPKADKSNQELSPFDRMPAEDLIKSVVPKPKPTPQNPVAGKITSSVAHTNKGPELVTDAQLRKLYVEIKNSGWTETEANSLVRERFKKNARKDLFKSEFDEVLNWIKTTPPPSMTDDVVL